MTPLTQVHDLLRADGFSSLAAAMPVVTVRVGRVDSFSDLGRDGWRIRIDRDTFVLARDGGPLSYREATEALDAIENETESRSDGVHDA